MMRIRTIAVAVLFTVPLSHTLTGQEPGPEPGKQPSPVPSVEPVPQSGDARYDRIQRSFEAEQSQARWWRYGWMAFYGANAAYSYGDAATTKNPVNHLVGGVAGTQALIGVLGLALTPLPATHAATTLRAMPSESAEDREKRLKEAEALLKVSAETENDGRSWIMHAANFLVAGAGAATIRYSYGKRIEEAGGSAPEQATINFWSSFLVGELQIWTQPTRSLQTQREIDGGPRDVSWLVVPSRDRISFAVGMRF